MQVIDFNSKKIKKLKESTLTLESINFDKSVVNMYCTPIVGPKSNDWGVFYG